MQKLVYIAGPLFNEGERWFNEQVDAVITRSGFRTFLPQRDKPEFQYPRDIKDIFKTDVINIDACDLMVIVLNGICTDDGSAWEMGYAYAKKKPIIGLFTDMRAHTGDAKVNLMLENSMNQICSTLEELESALKKH